MRSTIKGHGLTVGDTVGFLGMGNEPMWSLSDVTTVTVSRRSRQYYTLTSVDGRKWHVANSAKIHAVPGSRRAPEQSGIEILADLLSLDGGKTPARVVSVIDSQPTPEAPIRDACEFCHAARAEHVVMLSGTIAGSSGPRTKDEPVRACTACYRAAMASVNERGHGGVTIYWHTRTVIGEPIRFNDVRYTTRYAFIEGSRIDDAWTDARMKARDLEPRYAPVITSCMFENPNFRRAYLVTRGGVDAVEYMTPGNAWGLAWEVRHLQHDDTFTCAEVDPMTGDVVEWLWVKRPAVGDVVVFSRGPWSNVTITGVGREMFTGDFDSLSVWSPKSREMSIKDLENSIKSGTAHYAVKGN